MPIKIVDFISKSAIFIDYFVLRFYGSKGRNRAWQTAFLKSAHSNQVETGFKTLLPQNYFGTFLENIFPYFDRIICEPRRDDH